MPKLYFASPRDLPSEKPQAGIVRRTMRGERTTVWILDLAARTVLETHKHDEEHLGVVMKGIVAMVIAGEQRILTMGDTYVVPAGAAHGTRVLVSDSQVVDVAAGRP